MAINQPLSSRDEPGIQHQKSAEPIITVNDLTKYFGEQVGVDSLNFVVDPGTIFGFIGPSGSGKTTTVRLLTGIYAPDSGSISVMGYDPQHFPRRQRENIGYMPQLFFLYPQLTVWENLNFVASLYGMNLVKRKSLRDLLEFVELTGHENKRVDQISGGMRRRLTLATTLVQDPDLIFLDEPTAGIDPVLRRKFWDHFQGLKDQGRTMFVTTQYVGEVAYCDQVGVMQDGKLIMVDTPEGIRYRTYGGEIVHIKTEHTFVETFLNEIREMPFVHRIIEANGTNLQFIVDEASTAMPDLMKWFGSRQIEIETMEEYKPPFDDVFVELIEKRDEYV